MKIIKLEADSVKRLDAIEITPTGNMVEITGKNRQGKTSILDAIFWAINGAGNIQSQPIHKGKDEARIRLDLGEIIVTRKFKKKDDGGFTTSVVVESAEGARFQTPQRMLDGLLGALSFDPLEFTRKPAKDQFDALKRFVPGVDFAAIDGRNKTDFEARTDVNRREREARAAARLITVPEDTPAEPVDESALVADLERAGEHNADIERRKAARESAAQTVARMQDEAAALTARAAELRRQADDLAKQASAKTDERGALQAKIDAAPPLPDPIDTSAVRAQIDAARAANAAVERRRQRDAHIARADALKVEADTLTATMAARQKEKADAIAAAKLPVDGLGFGDGVVTLNGLPFDQASDAEQLRTSVAIAMAANPKLRVIRVRDGNPLDADAMTELAKMADLADCQVWIETVRSDGRVAFTIEDGRLAVAAEPATEQGALL